MAQSARFRLTPTARAALTEHDDDDLNRRLAKLTTTDLGNVERFVARYRDRLVRCKAVGWLFWDGKRWSRQGAQAYVLRAEHATVRAIQDEAAAIETGAAGDLTRREGAEIEELAHRLRAWGRSSEALRKMTVANRARAHMEVLPERLDADLWSINVQNGTLILIIAGAGTGKSSIFKQRILYWLEQTPDARVLALSFVRKLVADLRADIDNDAALFKMRRSIQLSQKQDLSAISWNRSAPSTKK